uniref:C-type lectin domain-containing protein n=1 Tax=Paramormyrops kingsleyae TaxID=1676925 RepID=A0A3B3SCV2_9TELE
MSLLHSRSSFLIASHRFLNGLVQMVLSPFGTAVSCVSLVGQNGTARRCSPCPSGWTFNNSKCYFVNLEKPWKTWNDSRLECIKMGADLLTIQNKEEQVRQSNELNHNSVTVLLNVIIQELIVYCVATYKDVHMITTVSQHRICLLSNTPMNVHIFAAHPPPSACLWPFS